MAKTTKKTIVVKQIGSPIRRPAKQRATLIGLGQTACHADRSGPEQDAQDPRIGRHAVDTRHGQQDFAYG